MVAAQNILPVYCQRSKNEQDGLFVFTFDSRMSIVVRQGGSVGKSHAFNLGYRQHQLSAAQTVNPLFE